MSGDVHVRFCERPEGQFLWATRLIVTASSKDMLEQEVKPVIAKFLQERGLYLSEEKTRVTYIEEGFDFLGFNIRKYQNKLKIKPAKDSFKSFLNKIRCLFKQAIALKQGKLIQLLNPVIRGWVNYYKPWVARDILHKVDHEIFKISWRWAKRRHGDKSLRWIRHRYFEGGSWYFKSGEQTLFKARMAESQRHIKIKAVANPFSPEWEPYFEKRLFQQVRNEIESIPKLKRIYQRQNGRCLQCQGTLSQEAGWHVHHLIPKVLGGKDCLDNLAMLHPNCHRQVHALNLKLNKPPKWFGKA